MPSPQWDFLFCYEWTRLDIWVLVLRAWAEIKGVVVAGDNEECFSGCGSPFKDNKINFSW